MDLNVDVDIDGFEDMRIRTLAYYISLWKSTCNYENRNELCDIYTWLITIKPSMEIVATNKHCPRILYYICKFGQNTDNMGYALLLDIKWELQRQMQSES